MKKNKIVFGINLFIFILGVMSNICNLSVNGSEIEQDGGQDIVLASIEGHNKVDINGYEMTPEQIGEENEIKEDTIVNNNNSQEVGGVDETLSDNDIGEDQKSEIEEDNVIDNENSQELEKDDTSKEIEEKVDVIELDLGNYEEEMIVGNKQLLMVTVLPLEATCKNVVYSSSNEDIASINSMGRIFAKKVGITTISAMCDGKKAEFNLTIIEEEVVDDKIHVEDIEIADLEDILGVGETLIIDANVLPLNASESEIKYYSSDESIATVNSGGIVKGISPGKVTITLNAEDIEKSLDLNIMILPEKIVLEKEYYVLKVGEKVPLNVRVYPEDADQTIEYLSKDAKVVSVSEEGVLSAGNIGNTTVFLSNGKLHKAITVIVNGMNHIKEEAETEIIEEELIKEYPDSDIIKMLKKKDNLIVNREKCHFLNSNILKYLYTNNKVLEILTDDYSLKIVGEKIRNFENELSTNLNIERNEENIVFNVNNGNELPGEIEIKFSEIKKYLYLYNESLNRYECLSDDNIETIIINSPGKYLLTNEKEIHYDKKTIILSEIIISIFLVGIIAFIVKKKRYWFW